MMNKEANNNRRPNGKMRRSRKKVCVFCAEKAEGIDYKDVNKKNFWYMCKASETSY